MSIIDEAKGILLSYGIDYDVGSATELEINVDTFDYTIKERDGFLEASAYPLTAKDFKEMIA